MTDGIRQESPLVRFDALPGTVSGAPGQAAKGATIVAAERAFLGHLNVRGDSSDAVFLDLVERVVGLALPLEPNTFTERGMLVACWLGPDEWLVITPGEREQEIAMSLRDALEDTVAAVTELSGGQTIIALLGSAVRDVLARGCTIDIHPRAMRPGHCVQTLFGKVPVLLRCVNETPVFEVVVRRSFADYAWSYLVDAARDEAFAIVSELP
ncbi:MAG: sarcosine oxidase subunit gamma [Gammaproteobacteria bacterium]|jgi:sarcosine oxidase subunit gamma